MLEAGPQVLLVVSQVLLVGSSQSSLVRHNTHSLSSPSISLHLGRALSLQSVASLATVQFAASPAAAQALVDVQTSP